MPKISKSHCVRGHILTPETTRYRKRWNIRVDGSRIDTVERECLECHRMREQRRKMKVRHGIDMPMPEVVKTNTCRQGHDLTDNTYSNNYNYVDRYGVTRSRTQLRCKTCKDNYRKEWYENGSRGIKGRTMCINGHILTDKNTVVESAGLVTRANGTKHRKLVRRCMDCRKKGIWTRKREAYEARNGRA